MNFKRTTALNKILGMTKRKKVVQGGTSAGKTVDIIAILIDKALKIPNREISIISESMPHLKRGARKDFIKIMKSTHRWRRSEWHATDNIYTFTNGSTIEFFSADNEEKVKGARRNDMYLNECNNVSFETFHQLMIRTNGDIYLDFNPVNEFWVHSEVLGDSDSELLVVNYYDNEALDEVTRAEISSAKEKGKTSDYWKNWYKVYGLGETGNLQGTIYTDWKLIDNLPRDKQGNLECELVAYGCDFGYSKDPTAIVALYKWNDSIIVDELMQRTGMFPSHIAEYILKNCEPNVDIIADSASPATIAEIQTYGINIYGVDKSGRDFMPLSIQSVQEQDMYITKRSVTFIKEVRTYVFGKDKQGRETGKPADGQKDHSCDATRYVIYTKLRYSGRVDEDTWSVY